MSAVKKFIHQWSWLLLIAFCTAGAIYPVIGVIALVCMLAPVATAFFKGRMWCGSFCPRGSFNDIILSKFSLKRPMPKLLKSTWFRIAFLVILMSAFAIQLIFTWGDAAAVGQVFVRMVIATTMLAIVLGVLYNQRTWCAICPMGTLAHYASKASSGRKGSKCTILTSTGTARLQGCQLRKKVKTL